MNAISLAIQGAHAMLPALSQIYIVVKGKELPDWIVERALGEPAEDGSFQLAATDEEVTVKPGFAVFVYDDGVYACLPRQVPDKLAQIAGDHPAVEELQHKVEARQEQRHDERRNHHARAADPAAQQLRIKPAIGEPPSPQFAAVDRLEIDDSYQRSIDGGPSQKLIVKIAENWDWRLCLPLLVSRRGAALFVIDGQHRLEAARMRGDIAHMPVVVFEFDNPRAEAELFVAANRARRAMSPLDDFHAAIFAGDPKASAINDAVNEAGLVVGRIQAWQYWKPGEIVFVKGVQRALHAHGKEITVLALKTVAQAFEGQVLTGGAAIFGALAKMIAEGRKAGPPVDLELMQIILSETGLEGWKAAAEGVNSAQERGDVMLDALRAAYAEAGVA